MDELSQGFGRALFRAFPNWEPLAKDAEDEKTGGHYIEVEVPQAGSDRGLHLSTADNEITISFDHWHTHVGPFLGIGTTESVDTAMMIIESFVAEQSVVKISRRDAVWIESGLEYLAAPSTSKPNSTTQVLSWRCTYDQTIVTRDFLPPSLSAVLKISGLLAERSRAPGVSVLRRARPAANSVHPDA